MEALSLGLAQGWLDHPLMGLLLAVAVMGSMVVGLLSLGRRLRSLDEQLLMAQQRLQAGELERVASLRELELLRAEQQHKQQQGHALQQQHTEMRAQLASAQASLNYLQGVEARLQAREQQLSDLRAEHQALASRTDAEQLAHTQQVQLLRDAKQQLTQEFEGLAHRIFDDKQQRFGQQSQNLLASSVNPLREQLSEFRQRVEDVYARDNADRHQLVGQIAELQKQTQQIGDDAVRLASALKGDNKVQGNWGEVVLERLLEESGLQKGREYELQVALKDADGRRRNPDVIIRLPERKDIIIDSKMSLRHYEAYCSADDETLRAQQLKLHIQSVRSHIQQLSAKNYEALEGVRTLDFVFIFMPVEAAFMLALQHEPGLYREAYERQIILVSPTTLLATLRTVENIWRYEKQNRNAEEIARQAGGLYDQFVLLLEALDDTGRQIEKAQLSCETAHKRLSGGRGNLLRRVESLKQLGAKSKKQLDPARVQAADQLEGGLAFADSVAELAPLVSDER